MRMSFIHTIFSLVFIVILFSCAAGPGVLESPPPSMESAGGTKDSTLAQETPMEETEETEETVALSLPFDTVLDSIAVLESTAEPESLPQEPVPETKIAADVVVEGSPVGALRAPPKPPIRLTPVIPEYIMGRGIILPEDMSAFLLGTNPNAGKEFVEDLALIYLEEATIEGVNHDAAFAQMCLETGFLRFGGLVTPDMNNFCGLGAIGPGQTGARFPDPRTGVRAHIQHLKAYATEAPLKQELVDPRYNLVRSGSSPAIKGLSGTWAADRSYADKIKNILERLYDFVSEI